MYAVASIIALVALVIAWKLLKRGPLDELPGFKSISYFPSLKPESRARELAREMKKYNGIMRVGPKMVVVDSKPLALEVLVKKDPDFANRDDGHQFLSKAAMGQVIGNTNYPAVQELRKAAFKALHLHGSGLQKLEAIIHEEVKCLLDEIEDLGGRDFAPAKRIYAALTNTMASLLLGEKFSYESEEARTIHEIDQRFAKIVTSFDTPEVNLYPWLLHLPFKRYVNKKKELQEFVQLRSYVLDNFVTKYKANYDPDNIHCVLSSLMKTQEARGSDVITDRMISGIMVELVVGGTLTTSTTLTGLVFALAHRPDVQDRMFAEISEVVGDGRMVKSEDKDSLPYVNAVILEVLRYQTVANLGVQRIAGKDSTIGGHVIPKNTTVLINQWAIHHNPETWEDADEFQPERFLDREGNLLPVDQYKDKGFMPFGGGRRACLGEALAKNRLFLMTSAIVQRFRILAPRSGNLPHLTVDCYNQDGTSSSPDYEVQFVPR